MATLTENSNKFREKTQSQPENLDHSFYAYRLYLFFFIM